MRALARPGCRSHGTHPVGGRDRPLKAEGTRFIRDGRRALLAAFASVLLASCATSDSDVPFGFATADLTPSQQTQAPGAALIDGQPQTAEAAASFVIEEGDPQLPDAVADAPVMRPGSEPGALQLAAAEPASSLQDGTAAAQTAPAQPIPSTRAEAGDGDASATGQADAGEMPAQMAAIEPAAPVEPKKRSFLSAFFSPTTPAASPRQAPRPLIDPTAPQPAARAAATPARPLVQLASNGQPATPLVGQGAGAGANPLPGVRDGNALYEISRRSGLDDDSDIDLYEDEEPSYQVASAAGLARLAPNGLMKQTEHVDVACLKPSLVRVLKAVENHYGKKVVVTSGYRSPNNNRRARGARNSLHMYCAAADVQVEGVSKWDLAKFVRTMPGRGGVGTYCHTDSVHIDVGPERDWNWRCRRRK